MNVLFRNLSFATATVALLGCLGKRQVLDMTAAPDEAVGRMAAAPDNSILAVGGTVQLSMSAVSLTGTPLTTFDSIAYRLATVSDSTTVRVSGTGLVTGLASTASSIPVNVIAFRQGTFNGDMVLVTVTPAAVPGLTLSIQPPPGDSTKLASGTAKTITPVFRNPTTGQSVNGIQLQYAVQPQDEARVGVYTPFVRIRDNIIGVTVHLSYSPAAARNQIVPYVGNGTAWIYANVNAYGTLLRDSVMYSFSYPYVGTIRVTKTNLAVLTALNAGVALAAAENPDLILAPGATITFTNGIAATDPLTVVFTFDTPAAATVATPPSALGGTSGNVTTLFGGQSATRKFSTPGTYHWTWVSSGGPAPWAGQTATGAIVIK